MEKSNKKANSEVSAQIVFRFKTGGGPPPGISDPVTAAIAALFADSTSFHGIPGTIDIENVIISVLGPVNRDRIRMYYFTMCFVKAVLGVGLVVCGVQGIRYTKGQDIFGPPYFVGAFITGSLLILSSVCSRSAFSAFNRVDLSSVADVSHKGHLVVLEAICTVFVAFTCVLGIFFVVMFGLIGCVDRWSVSGTCSYNENISENKTISLLILIGLTSAVGITAVSVYTCCCSQLFSTFARAVPIGYGRRRRLMVSAVQEGIQQHYHVQAALRMAGTQPNFTYGTSAPGSIIPGEQLADAQTRNLEEQNRLLREQLELQARLNQPQHMQGGVPSQVSPRPAPPSYSDCFQSPGTGTAESCNV